MHGQPAQKALDAQIDIIILHVIRQDDNVAMTLGNEVADHIDLSREAI